MALLNQKAFAALAGCSDPAVSKAVSAGRLARSVDADGNAGIDPASEMAQLFIAAVAAQKVADLAAGGTGKNRGGRPRRPEPPPKPEAKPRGRPPAPRPAPVPAVQGSGKRPHPSAPRMPAPPAAPGGPSRTEYRDEEIALKNRLLRTKVQRETRAEWRAAGKTASTRVVAAAFGRLGAALEAEFRPFADRHADSLAAMGSAGAGRVEFATYLEAEIDKVLASLAKQMARAESSLVSEADDGLG